LTTCGELSLGLFTTATPGALNAATLATGRPVETGREDGAIGVLMAHIVATKSMEVVVSDEAMDYPLDWESEHPAASTKGHRAEGRTICLHSLAVLPNFQGKNLGRTLLMAYTNQMDGTGIADRISLIAHEVSFTRSWRTSDTDIFSTWYHSMRVASLSTRVLAKLNLEAETGLICFDPSSFHGAITTNMDSSGIRLEAGTPTKDWLRSTL